MRPPKEAALETVQWMFDEMANARLRFIIEGEVGDVDASMQDEKGREIANGHGEDFGSALADLIERHSAQHHTGNNP